MEQREERIFFTPAEQADAGLPESLDVKELGTAAQVVYEEATAQFGWAEMRQFAPDATGQEILALARGARAQYKIARELAALASDEVAIYGVRVGGPFLYK